MSTFKEMAKRDREQTQLEYRLMHYFQEKGIDSDVGTPSQYYATGMYFSFYVGECAPKYWKGVILPEIIQLLTDGGYRIYTQQIQTEKAFDLRITCQRVEDE